MQFIGIEIRQTRWKTKDKVILQGGFVHFCSPVRLEFSAHVFCECCGKSLHISLVVVVKEDSKLHYIHTVLLTKPYD